MIIKLFDQVFILQPNFQNRCYNKILIHYNLKLVLTKLVFIKQRKNTFVFYVTWVNKKHIIYRTYIFSFFIVIFSPSFLAVLNYCNCQNSRFLQKKVSKIAQDVLSIFISFHQNPLFFGVNWSWVFFVHMHNSSSYEKNGFETERIYLPWEDFFFHPYSHLFVTFYSFVS